MNYYNIIHYEDYCLLTIPNDEERTVNFELQLNLPNFRYCVVSGEIRNSNLDTNQSHSKTFYTENGEVDIVSTEFTKMEIGTINKILKEI